MSMTIWLNLRAGDKHESDGEDRSALFALHEDLDRVATALGVAPLSMFFDETDVSYNLEAAEDFAESEEGWPASAASWHDPQAILASVHALSAHLVQHPMAIAAADGWTQKDLLDDLNSLVPGLQAAIDANQSAHLLVVM